MEKYVDGPPIGKGGPGSIRSEMARALSDASVISHDAHRAQISRYHDRVLLAVALFMLGSIFCYFMLSGQMGQWVPSTLQDKLMLSISIGSGIALVVLWTARGMKARAETYERWSFRLLEAARHEMGVETGQRESSIELLLEMTEALPEWLKVRRSSGLEMGTAVWLASFFFMLYGMNAVAQFLMPALNEPTFGNLFMLATGVILTSIGVVIIEVWKWDARRKDRSIIASWQGHMDGLLHRFEEM